MTTSPRLALRGVERTFRQGELETPVLRGVSLDVAPGESVAVVGPSGSGKSTLMNLAGALDRPTAGTIELDGADLAALTPREQARVRNQKIGFVFQSHHLLPYCTALENVLAPSLVDEDRRRRREAPQRARELLERVGLADRLDFRPGRLSGGQCQRVAVVRALINQPALVLADEPTGSLDQEASRMVMDLLLSLTAEAGASLLVVTHDRNVARRMARQVTLIDGRLTEGAEDHVGAAREPDRDLDREPGA